MEEYIKSAKKLLKIQEEIKVRQTQWKDLKITIKNLLELLGSKTGLEYEVQLTDHIEHWESVSIRLPDEEFSVFVKGKKRQPIIKKGAYLVYGLLPSGFIKVGMVFPKIEDIKQKEIPFLQFELVKDFIYVNEELLSSHFNRFLQELIAWELGEGGNIKERIGFKQSG